MKVAIITDTHFGARGDSPVFLEHFLNFFENEFFPYIKEHDIKHIIHMGDLMDRRKFVNFLTLKNVRDRFMQRIIDENISTHIVIGNHDIYFRNTNDVNSVEQLFDGESEFVKFYAEPTTIEIGGKKLDLLPWINRGNKEGTLDFLRNTTSHVCFGHLEITGHLMLPGVKCEGGLDPKFFKKYKKVYSGHFHTKSSDKNVSYLGTAYQITFSDWGIEKGFHIFDTETYECEFVENKKEIFHKIVYENKPTKDVDFDKLKNCYVKVIVTKKDEVTKFEKFLDKLYDSGVEDVTIVEQDESYEPSEDEIDISVDTITLIEDEIDSQEVKFKEEIKKLAKEIYLESIDE